MKDPMTDFTCNSSKIWNHPRMCLLGVLIATEILRGTNPTKKKKGAWWGIFQPNWQNNKIVISLWRQISDRHEILRGYWNCIVDFMGGPIWQNSNSRWRKADILENVGNVRSRLSMDRFGRKLGGHIPSCPQYIRHDAVAVVTAVA